jgi:hypothetical protein
MSIDLREGGEIADARRSFSELARHARSLGALSANAATYAAEVTQDYHAALFAKQPSAPAWRKLVSSADRLLERAEAVATYGSLRAEEVVARDFFAQLVDENRDLLAAPAVAA